MEKWLKGQRPQRGDIVRVKRNKGYCHFGIACSDKEVIHFTGLSGDDITNPENIKIRKTSLDQFERGDQIEILDNWYSPFASKDVLKRAEAYLESSFFRGKHYNFFTNNCEHFARYCYFGEATSSQVENGLTAAAVLTGAVVTAAVVNVTNAIKDSKKNDK